MNSIINIPVVRIKKSKLSHDELIKLFETKENEGKAWEKSFFNALYDDNKEALKELMKGSGITDKKLANYYMDLLIAYFTEKGDQGKKFFALTKRILLGDGDKSETQYVKSIEIDGDILKIQTKDGSFGAAKLSSVYPYIHKLFPEIEGSGRYGYCHDFSKRLAKALNKPCHVATGYIAPLSRKSKVLHSWVEYERDGEVWVLDVTRNLFMKKSVYYKLRGVSYPVYKISRQTLFDDQEMISYLFDKELWSGKVYFANRPLAVWWYNKLKGQEKGQQKSESVKSEMYKLFFEQNETSEK